MDNSSQYNILISQIKEDVDDALEELLRFALIEKEEVEDNIEEKTNKNIENKKEIQNLQEYIAQIDDFLQVVSSSNEAKRNLREYIFELLKAFGCSSHLIDTDVEKSKENMDKISSAYPQFLWAKNFYWKNVSLDELNPYLSENKDNYVMAKEKLDAWLQ